MSRGATHITSGRLDTFAGYSQLEVEVCTCGVLFAAPESMLDSRRQDGRSFYCPNGHSLAYSSENASLKRQLANERDRAGRLAAERDQTKASLAATKGHLTRARHRAASGVCPVQGCKRHFKDLERHIASKHPDFKETP